MKGKTSHLVQIIKGKIREIMDSKNLTQQMLANKMDTSQQSINDLLNNNKDLTITKMEKAAKALEKDITDLLPCSFTQNNAEGAKDIVQVQINDVEVIMDKMMYNHQQQMELLKQLFEYIAKNKD